MTLAGLSEQNVKLNIEVVTHGSISWINVQRPGLAEMQYLKERFNFHQLSLDDCLSVVQMPKMDEFDDHIFLVLHFPRFNKESRITQANEVDVFAGSNYIVTLHDGNLRPLTKLFQDCQLSKDLQASMMGQGSGYLLYRILDTLVDYCFPILNKIIDNVNLLEEQVFETWDQQIVRDMALLRHDILSYRRIVRPQIEVLEAMEAKRFPFLRLNPDIYFGDLADHMRRIWSELEDQKEMVEGLYDSQGSLANLHTNDITRILTGLAIVALPILLIASLYGMNVDLPLADQGWAFWVLLYGTLVMSVGLLVFLRIRRWL
ncbi:MAG: magnesium transporter CorA family protein [Chloroflexi bacterium]|nr:magnesium transporter CorA family protein [Chloroflexota bacterium]